MTSVAATDNTHQRSTLVECPLCRDTLRDPRLLPCVHTCCLECLKSVCQYRLPGDKVPCPICRHEFGVPQNGVRGLPKNAFVEQMKDSVGLMSTWNKVAPCEVCSGENTASSYCVECMERMCDACAECHSRMKVSRKHKVVAMEDAEECLESHVQASCCLHPDNDLQSYCFDCKSAICVTCSVEIHGAHSRAPVDQVASELRRQMTSDVKNMVDTIVRCQEMIRDGKRSKAALKSRLVAVETQICDRVEQLKAQIEREKRDLLKELAAYNTEGSKQIDDVVEKLEQRARYIESLVIYTEQVRDKGTACDVAQQTSTLHSKACELSNMDDLQRVINVVSCTDVTFTASLWPSPSSGRVVGDIRQLNKEVELIHSITVGDYVAGLTTLNNELYVCYNATSYITVYDTEKYRFQRQVNVPGLGRAIDMTSCKQNDCVYISDVKNSLIRRIANKDHVTQWAVLDDKPSGISVNSAYNVLVTCKEVSKVKEFTTDGGPVRVITLQNDIKNPFHTVEMAPDLYAVCHGALGDQLHRVCTVDYAGHVHQTYGGMKGCGDGNLTVPVRLAASGNIYVCDQNNHRVLILSRALSYVGEAVSGLRFPARMWFDEQRARLYVADDILETRR